MEVLLESGQQIELVMLEQRLTYDGYMEGVPLRRVNDAAVAAAHDQALERFGAAHLVEPLQTPLERSSDRFDDPAVLPRVSCVSMWRGRLEDPAIESTLAVVWWQDNWAMPVAEDVVEAIRRIDWSSGALRTRA